MRTFLLAFCCVATSLVVDAQNYQPIKLWGYNHDVIAEGPGRDAAAQTTKEMDARDPSNYVLFTKRFAKALAMPASYGLPDNGKITAGARTFQLTDFNVPNALYLLKGERRVMSIVRPLAFDALSILGFATEGPVSISLIIYFIDGTSLRYGTIAYDDWFDGPDALLMGFGRVKRAVDSQETPLYYEGAPSNPRFYAAEVVPPKGKVIQSIQFQNTSPGESKDSNRAFIFAISGIPYIKEETTEEKPKEIVPIVTEQKPKETKEADKEIPFLHGTITDANSHKPIEADVQFTFGSSGNTVKTIEGVYRLFAVHQLTLFDKKEYILKVTSPGYLYLTERVTAANWPAHNRLNLALNPIEVGAVVNLKSVLFKQSTAVLLIESYPELDAVAEFLTVNPKVRIEIAGHTDNRGSPASNIKLSDDRAAAVKKYLITKGVVSSRMIGKGYGSSKPIARNDTEDARRLNRRVEFIITGK
jgi:outer membrane protein OmpA-like peptidoglycan-associated protein